MKKDDTPNMIRAVLGLPLPDDDKDFTPELARTVIALYRDALARALSEIIAAKSIKH